MTDLQDPKPARWYPCNTVRVRPKLTVPAHTVYAAVAIFVTRPRERPATMVGCSVAQARYNPLAMSTGPWCGGLMVLVFAMTIAGLPGCLRASGPPRLTTTVQSSPTPPAADGTAVPPPGSGASGTGPAISGPVTRPAVTPGSQPGGAASTTPAPAWKPGDPVQERQDLRRSN
jgi:hypothetical protein